MPVQTRSQSVKKSAVNEPLPKQNNAENVLLIPGNELYEVNIDFDEASAAWRSNKRRVGESWVYSVARPKRSGERRNWEEVRSEAITK